MCSFSVVVLTLGDRPEDLSRAIDSARSQTGVNTEVVLVVNGGAPDLSLADVVVQPSENTGIPEGRNIGANAASGEYLCFLDDDGQLVTTDIFSQAAARMEENANLSVIALRIVDEFGKSARRHFPGLRKKYDNSGFMTSFPGGASIMRRKKFLDMNGFCGEFFYGLEETDLAWRLLDDGEQIKYCSDLLMQHPRTLPTRHAMFAFNTSRNRVWLVHRLLPLPLAVLYIINWIIISCLRNFPHPRVLKGIISGTIAGLQHRVGPRTPISWRTIFLMSRLGRPPII